MLNQALLSPSDRIIRTIGPEEALAEITLSLRFGETHPIRSLLQRWQIDARVHALVSRVVERRPACPVLPARLANSDTYLALEGSSVGFVVQFAALCACHDTWGRQALLAFPQSANGLWGALVWAGTGRGRWAWGTEWTGARAVAELAVRPHRVRG